MLARVKTQVRRKRFADRLRDSVQMTMEMAITDGLTGLHNRRYLERHLATLVAPGGGARQAAVAARSSTSTTSRRSTTPTAMTPATTCCANSPTASARRCAASISPAGSAARSSSWRCPTPTAALGLLVGERIRQKIASEPFKVESGTADLSVTVSIGVSSLMSSSDTPQSMLKRADEALYRAKRDGRNRVAAAA